MFDKLFSVFKGKKEVDRPVKSGFLSPKGGAAVKPAVVSTDRKGPLPAVIQDRPSTLLLPGVNQAPQSKPIEDFKPMVQLPPDIDPSQVIVVRHDTKKADGERFKYSDKPLKPLDGDARRPDVIKYNDRKTTGDVLKYKTSAAVKPSEPETRKGEVFKYTPVRVEIKS
jgi:hypothetical protein